jgi:hypothetical protein
MSKKDQQFSPNQKVSWSLPAPEGEGSAQHIPGIVLKVDPDAIRILVCRKKEGQVHWEFVTRIVPPDTLTERAEHESVLDDGFDSMPDNIKHFAATAMDTIAENLQFIPR